MKTISTHVAAWRATQHSIATLAAEQAVRVSDLKRLREGAQQAELVQVMAEAEIEALRRELLEVRENLKASLLRQEALNKKLQTIRRIYLESDTQLANERRNAAVQKQRADEAELKLLAEQQARTMLDRRLKAFETEFATRKAAVTSRGTVPALSEPTSTPSRPTKRS